jgi:multiple sugar transport system permease protein
MAGSGSDGAVSGAVNVKGRGLMIGLAVAPLLLYYIVFLIFPMSYSFVMSFFDWNIASMLQTPKFIGLDNYNYALFTDDVFWIALKNTLYYAVLSIPTGIVVALTLAVFINNRKYFRSYFRTAYFLPVLTSMVAAGIIWRWLYQPQFGLINSMVRLVGDTIGVVFPEPRWLLDPSLAMPSIAAMAVWNGAGYTMVIFLAALQGIPETYYEAARVDGANSRQAFRFLTIPLLRPALVFVLVTGLIGALQAFTAMYVMTQGGPVNSTRTIVYILYDQAFRMFRFGYASSIAFLLFAIIMLFTLLQVRFLRVGWEY